MIELTRLEVGLLLDVLREVSDPNEDPHPEELAQAIEILEAGLREFYKR